MKNSHADLATALITLWYANMAWAKELLMRSFGLKDAQEILGKEYRGLQQVPGTCWYIRTHGIGVDIFKTPDVGGIDFDFDKPDPDAWRLKILFEKQINDGQLSYSTYRDLVEDEELLDNFIKELIQGHNYAIKVTAE